MPCWTIAQCSHYSYRLETNETIKKKGGDEESPTASGARHRNLFSWSRGSALLWACYSSKQAIILSATWLTCSWCRVFASSLWGFFFSRYSGNWRKSQEQKQTRPDITLVPWAQAVSLLDEIVREGCVLNIGPENFVRPPFHLFLQRALLSSNKSKDLK